MPGMRNRSFEAFSSALSVLVTLIALFPLAWMAVAGFKPEREVLSVPLHILPSAWKLDSFRRLFADTTFPFLAAMRSTLLVSTAAALLSLTVNSMAAYAFARLEFRGKRALWVATIMTMYIPGITILLTSFILVRNLGMLDTLAVLILPGVANAYSIFFFRQFFLNMPASLEEAALIDGATRFRIFTHVYIPNALSPLVIIGVGTFLGYWNSFIWPTMTVTKISHLQVMQVIRSFSSMYSTRYGTVMAGSTLAALPPIILFLVFQRHIVKGIIISGIK
jgi:multiple sugar transport system permease protein